MQRGIHFLIVICFCLVGSRTGCLAFPTGEVVAQSAKEAELSNAALKKLYDLGEPDCPLIKKLLSAHDFKALDHLFRQRQDQYEKDVGYEWLLQQSYNVFTPDEGITAEDLDAWIAETGSFTAYAARGRFLAQLGFTARGVKFTSETSSYKIKEMQFFLNEAAKDLEIAIAKNPLFMPAYSCMVRIAKASKMPFSPKEILNKAEENDKRTFYVRCEYMNSLLPRWGGSYEEMAEFAKYAIKYDKLNPLLWSLQGDVDADLADIYNGEGKWAAAIASYTAALKFGDRVSWLKSRAACYSRNGEKDKAMADSKRVVYYTPSDVTAKNLSTTGNELGFKLDVTDKTSVDPKIRDLDVKTYVVVSVDHQVGWLTTRSDKGRSVLENHAQKIERVVRGMGYGCLDRSQLLRLLQDQHLTPEDLTQEQRLQLAKSMNADAIIIANIPSMGKNHAKNMYFEDIDIKAVSVATGSTIWSSSLKGSTLDQNSNYAYTYILNVVENELYTLLQSKLKAQLPSAGKQ